MSENTEEIKSQASDVVYKYPPMAVSFKRKKVPKKEKEWTPSNQYSNRKYGLEAIGFSSYPDYLKSDLWKSVRDKVFKKKGRQCVRCQAFATEVHHADYSRQTLAGESLKRLHPICRKCHEYIEFDENGNKRSIADANIALNRATIDDRRISKSPKVKKKLAKSLKRKKKRGKMSWRK